MNSLAIYPGSFDPVTNGHIDIIDKSLGIFDKIVVAIIVNPSKKTLFSIKEREMMLKSIFKDNEKIEIRSFEGLLVDFATLIGADTVIRGLRAVSDFEYEFQMALMNQRLNPKIKSVYLMPSPEFSFISSSIIKEVFFFGGDIAGLVPRGVVEFLEKKREV
ncbi:MAG: pantetheine-phosphate adenylyltransferase [Elusimicrobia bacterium]|nr:pantetheine-phosphate adenylyltransferase [Elusimicrobiota bacterium]